MTDEQNAQQWAMDAAREILRYWQLEGSGYVLERMAAIIEKHMAQRDRAVAEAVREEMLKFEESADLDGNYDPTYYNGWLAGITDYARHTESIDLAPIIASVTKRGPERCVWTWNDRLMMFVTDCGFEVAKKGRGVEYCFGCERRVEVKEADDPNKTFYTLGYGKEADDD